MDDGHGSCKTKMEESLKKQQIEKQSKMHDVELSGVSMDDDVTPKALSIKITSTSTSTSPSLVSPSSSAFVSALQSPYISPRAILSASASASEEVPSSSYTYTPPSDHYDFSDHCIPLSVSLPDSSARLSFSFPVPRVSFTKGSLSPPHPHPHPATSSSNANAKLRSCDVYVGFHGNNPNLLRFCKWLKSDLELQGIACFLADRANYSDSQSHEIADRVICSVTYGVVLVTSSSLLNRLTLEEIRFFSQKKNLVPIFFDPDVSLSHNTTTVDKEAIDALLKCNDYKLGADGANWRQCIARASGILRAKLGRKSVARKPDALSEIELPFPRNSFFVGRDKEISEMESAFFGCGAGDCLDSCASSKGEASGQSEGFADEESDVVVTRSFLNLEMGKCNEPNLEAWIEGRCSRRPKYKKSKTGNTSVICINGVSGIGKTELALEFAYRYSQRYKMVLWLAGEARYLRQNILNLSLNLGLDVSADPEKERGRIRSFDEQELEAFKRVKRELFRDMPYLIIIDNLENEREWWEGKDLHDLIPRNTGGSHIIITSRLSKVMNFDTMQLPPLPLKDAMVLIRGRRKRDYPAQELDFLKKLDEKLGSLSFGLWLVGSLLSELSISPSALFEAVNQMHLDEASASSPCLIGIDEEQYCKNNPFLMKLLSFCFAVLQQTNGRAVNRLASRMILVSAWFAPTPISSSLLGVAAEKISNAGNCYLRRWLPSAWLLLGCCSTAKNWKSEEDSALLLVKLGLARRANHKQHQTAGCWIQFHSIAQIFAKRNQLGLQAAKATVESIRKIGNPLANLDHLWASAFLVFGFKSEPPLVQLKANDMVLYIRRTALPLAIRAFTTFSRCNSALELLKVCTNVLEEIEKSFVSQIQDWYCHGSLCWKKKKKKKSTTTTTTTTMTMTSNQTTRVDEYVWQDVTLLKASLLEMRAKLLLRGGNFDSGEELCRTCISIRTVMLGHNNAQTLAAQETLAKLVRMRSKI